MNVIPAGIPIHIQSLPDDVKAGTMDSLKGWLMNLGKRDSSPGSHGDSVAAGTTDPVGILVEPMKQLQKLFF